MIRGDHDAEETRRRVRISIDDYGGIVPHADVFYLHSIIYSASRCLASFEEYEHSKKLDVPPEYVVSIVQEAVGHAAALSRYFWPSLRSGKKRPPLEELKEKRGEVLRAFFELTETSPLYNRDLRNAWEHFDERLDAYMLGNDAGYFFPGCILDTHTLADDPLGHIFKLLDTEAECLVLMHQKYFFGPIRDEVGSVFERALRAEKNGGRLRQDLTVSR
jgi:hypothetical protein